MPGAPGISYVRKDSKPMQYVIETRECPYCKAKIGELCRVVATGKPIISLGQVHDARLSKVPVKRSPAMIRYL